MLDEGKTDPKWFNKKAVANLVEESIFIEILNYMIIRLLYHAKPYSFNL